MNPAPYNPDTLAVMRKSARFGLLPLCRMIGWTEQRTLRVARDHGIEIGPAASEFMPSPTLAPSVDPMEKPPAPAPRPTIITFGKRQAQIYEVLVRHSPNFISGQALGELLGIPIAHVSSYVHPIGAKLKLAGIALHSRMGRGNSGYRIMPPADGSFPTMTPSREFVLPSPVDDDSSQINPHSPRNSQGGL
jgi:biotin operon repressor